MNLYRIFALFIYIEEYFSDKCIYEIQYEDSRETTNLMRFLIKYKPRVNFSKNLHMVKMSKFGHDYGV